MTEYRIDDLSRAAGTTSRNVRVYQERGLLDPPRLVGRTGWYTEEQLTRVRLICQLVERGHTLNGIRDMLDTWERGGDLQDLLGVERVITRPWLDDEPQSTTLADMQRRFGAELTPDNAERAAELGLIEPDGVGIRMPSPRIIDAGTALVELGVPFATVLDIAEEMKSRATTIAALFVEPIRDQLVPDGVIPPPEELTPMAEAIDILRPLAFSATEAFLAQAMLNALTQVFGSAVLQAQEQANTPE